MKSVPLLNPRRDLVSSAGKNEIKFVFDFEIAAICLHFCYCLPFNFRCGFDEKLECEPLACEPQPMMKKMLAIRR